MSKIYRVLNDYECMLYNRDQKIYCNSDFDGIFLVMNWDHYYLDDNLDNLISHVQCGNNTYSKWISCSSDFITDIQKYAVPNIEHSKIYRPNIAVIENYEKSSLWIDGIDHEVLSTLFQIQDKSLRLQMINQIRSLPLCKIKKMVINLNDNQLLYQLFHSGFIQTINGGTPQLTSRAIHYAQASKEVAILEKIPKLKDGEGVSTILTPLTYDVLYTLIQNGSLSDTLPDNELHSICFFLKSFPTEQLSTLEKSLYQIHYGCNHSLKFLIDLYNDPRLDVLSFYQSLLQVKRSLLKKVVIWLNYKLKTHYNHDIYLIEDNNYVIRQEGNYQTVDVELLDNTLMKVSPISVQTSRCITELKCNQITSAFAMEDSPSKPFYVVYNNKLTPVYIEKNKVIQKNAKVIHR